MNTRISPVHGRTTGPEEVLLPTTEQKVFARRPQFGLRHHTEQGVHWLAGMTRAVLRGLLTRWFAPVKEARVEQAGLNARRRSAQTCTCRSISNPERSLVRWMGRLCG
jgi:hypothetical protein